MNAATLHQTDSRVGFGASSRSTRVTFASSIQGKRVDLPSARLLTEDHQGVGIRFFARLARYLWRHRRDFDFVHFFTTKLILTGPYLCAVMRIPSLVTVTGMGRALSRNDLRGRAWAFTYRTIMAGSIRLAAGCFFENEAQMELFGSWYPGQQNKLEYVGGGVARGHLRPRVPPDGPALRVIHVARLLPEKGVLDFIRVAGALSRDRFRFVLVGPASPDHPRIAAEVRAAADAGVIEYRGVLGHEDLWAEYARSDVLLFPSTYAEGLPRVLLECGLAGVCPVAYAIDGTVDVIGVGHGFLVAPRDVVAATRTIEMLAEDRHLLTQNAEAYNAHVLEHFSIEAFTKRLDAAMERTHRRRRRTAG